LVKESNFQRLTHLAVAKRPQMLTSKAHRSAVRTADRRRREGKGKEERKRKRKPECLFII
jgi:hypothetical protein